MKLFWKYARWFTGFWILYGIVKVVYNFTKNQAFDFQTFALALGMAVIFFKRKKSTTV